MYCAPAFDRTDLLIVMPNGMRREIVVYHEGEQDKVILEALEEADAVGGVLEIGFAPCAEWKRPALTLRQSLALQHAMLRGDVPDGEIT
jgi:hypothetical protein